jgi:4'-phosphopantetheinyl transferase
MIDSATHSDASATAHLWFLETGIFGEPSATQQWLARLEQHERVRYAAYRSATAGRGYLATRALARTALAYYSGQPAERLCLGTDRLGRPQMTSPAMPRLHFSLANTRQLAVGLFAFDRNVGVDAELVAPIGTAEIAGHFFSAQERAELATLGDAARRSRFYELWTLREAYLKARGVGLTLPLDQLVFRLTSTGTVHAEFGPAIRDDPLHWQFGLVRLTARHLAATCVRRPSSDMPVRIVHIDALAMTGAETSRQLA